MAIKWRPLSANKNELHFYKSVDSESANIPEVQSQELVDHFIQPTQTWLTERENNLYYPLFKTCDLYIPQPLLNLLDAYPIKV
jgi:hypothetical protein